MLSWIFIVLAHWSNSPQIDMLPISDTLSWFRAIQFLLFLLNAACLATKQQISNFIVFGLTRSGFEPTIYCSRGEHANHYNTDAVKTKLISKVSLNRVYVPNVIRIEVNLKTFRQLHKQCTTVVIIVTKCMCYRWPRICIIWLSNLLTHLQYVLVTCTYCLGRYGVLVKVPRASKPQSYSPRLWVADEGSPLNGELSWSGHITESLTMDHSG
jgi:hypothetical protein